MKVFAVIVTYSDRFDFLNNVIESIKSQGISKIIVVDNNSHEDSRKRLKTYEKINQDIIQVLYLPENTGSAGGFKIGLEEAYNDAGCEFVWLFDDDNMAKKDALKALKDFWESASLKEDNAMLMSLRSDRKKYLMSIEKNDPEVLIGKINSFMTFDFLNYMKNKFFTQNNFKGDVLKNYVLVPQAPYGGMFFHKSLIGKIGYPNENYYLYNDDTEYSYRVIKNGGNIYAVLDSLLEDIDVSWSNVKNMTVLNTPDDFRVYYTFRNRVHFEINNRVDNKFVYFFNMGAFLSRLFVFAVLRFKFRRYLMIIGAIIDGLNGKLGKREIK